MKEEPNEGSLPPTGSDHSGDSSGHDASSLKGLTMALGMEPVEPGRDPLLGCDIGGVKVVRLIAEGGMGRVYEGQQEKPRRTVAVKVMRPGLTSPSLLKRFEYETEVLGRLQHPGIAQIYAVGVHPIGSTTVPYFIMEYIAEARSLTAYAEELKLPTRQRLDLFRSVCDAVAHGHQKGVIHRDLKPSNILVDGSGQPKVIDFGVARATESDMALTTMQTDVGQLIGTLQYMSPEQFDANPNDIDIRSDVYALGVILYELLTGKPPYDLKKKAVLEAMRIVKEDDPTPISSLNKTLRRDVAVIAGKCLNKDRGRRYSSASELSSDISRYLSGEPILAAPPSFGDGLVRLARRHRAAATALVGILVSLAVALVAISLFAIRAERARLDAVTARDSASILRRSAEELAEYMTIKLHDRLAGMGRLDILEQVFDKLANYQAERSQREAVGEENADPVALHHRALFFSRLASLAESSGDTATAEHNHRQSVAISELLLAHQPDNPDWHRDLGNALFALARLMKRIGSSQAAHQHESRAIKHYESYLARMVAYAAQDPDNLERQRVLARGYNNFAVMILQVGDYATAKAHYENAIAVVSGLVGRDHRAVDAVEVKRDLARYHRNLGDAAFSASDIPATAQHFREAVDLLQSINAHAPSDTRDEDSLAYSYSRLADAVGLCGDATESQLLYKKALDLRVALCRQDPRNTAWKRSLALAYGNLGNAQEVGGNNKEAHHCYSEAAALFRDLLTAMPADAYIRRDLAMSLLNVARMSSDVESAHGPCQEATVLFAQCVKEDPEQISHKEDLAGAHRIRGDIAVAEADSDFARKQYEMGLMLLGAGERGGATNAESSKTLFKCLAALGKIDAAASDWEGAIEYLKRAERVLVNTENILPKDLLLQARLDVLRVLVRCYRGAGNEAAERHCLETLKTLTDSEH